MKYIGKHAIGIMKDTSFRNSYKGDFPRGWKTEGEIKEFDPKKQKYLIEGSCYIFNETGTFRIDNMTGDWYSRKQIQIIDDE